MIIQIDNINNVLDLIFKHKINDKPCSGRFNAAFYYQENNQLWLVNDKHWNIETVAMNPALLLGEKR